MTRVTKREKIETNRGDDEDGRGDHEDSACEGLFIRRESVTIVKLCMHS